ncbi:RICIN domain-containing protein [Kitasatospora sp. NPDC101183]|uniref:RICIN domain-containing protein n=1 Tax=Kitasatospora sp. NPDC101183 TaxID=3364100 RepID=UPI0038207154
MKKKLLGTLVTAASLTALLLPASAASAATQTTSDLTSGHLRNPAVQGNQCLVHFSNGSAGDNPAFYTCLNYDDQTWYYPKPGTIGPIINKYSLKYMTAQGYDPSPAFLYFNSGYPDQQWSADYLPGSQDIQFRNQHSNLCLTVNSSGNLIQDYCQDFYRQAWFS